MLLLSGCKNKSKILSGLLEIYTSTAGKVVDKSVNVTVSDGNFKKRQQLNISSFFCHS